MAMKLDERTPAFEVVEREGKYAVVDANGRTLLQCADADSAAHYADLMGQAYVVGYKMGYRDARGD